MNVFIFTLNNILPRERSEAREVVVACESLTVADKLNLTTALISLLFYLCVLTVLHLLSIVRS